MIKNTKEFYTSVVRRGNNLLYRGYKNGERVKKKIAFKPTLFVNSDKTSPWKTLDGQNVAPVTFDSMSEATEFDKLYRDVSNVNVYGMNNMVFQYIAKKFPTDIEFDRSSVEVTNFDIEVASTPPTQLTLCARHTNAARIDAARATFI